MSVLSLSRFLVLMLVMSSCRKEAPPPPKKDQVEEDPPTPVPEWGSGKDFVYLKAEVDQLLVTKVAPIPTLQEIQSLVNGGLPKPAEDFKRAMAAHNTLDKWGKDTITAAFRSIMDPDVAQRKYHASYVVESISRWTSFGTNFGDFEKNAKDYGNVNLELIWFCGNLVRALKIVESIGRMPEKKEFNLPTDKQKGEFIGWISAIESRYIKARFFTNDKSNRKASQIEVMMRIADLKQDRNALNELFNNIFVDFINSAIAEGGTIPEDSGRDKYHPQFLLASALQILELGKLRQLRLDVQNKSHAKALRLLQGSLAYAATTNQNNSVPEAFPGISDPKANYEIPFWFLAPRFLKDYGLKIPDDVMRMREANYADSSRFDFTMMWGFNAVATKYGI
jgi:hypothetical protein